jgi:uncharacterized circularly permuted ATP-grasp superfamily protein
VIPEHVVSAAKGPQCVGLKSPPGVWCHITGTDLVRDTDGQYYVLRILRTFAASVSSGICFDLLRRIAFF